MVCLKIIHDFKDNKISKNHFPASLFSHREFMIQPFHIVSCLSYRPHYMLAFGEHGKLLIISVDLAIDQCQTQMKNSKRSPEPYGLDDHLSWSVRRSEMKLI